MQTPQTSSAPLTNSRNFQNVYSVLGDSRASMQQRLVNMGSSSGETTGQRGDADAHTFRRRIHVKTKLCRFKLPLSRCQQGAVLTRPASTYALHRAVLSVHAVLSHPAANAMQCSAPTEFNLSTSKVRQKLRPSAPRTHSTSAPRRPTSPSFPPSGPHSQSRSTYG